MADQLIQFFNGRYLTKEEIHISPDDVGLLRGYAVFDFFRVSGKHPIFIEDHLDRLASSANEINLALPVSRQELLEIISELIERNNLPESTIKIVVTGGVTSNGFTPGSPTLMVLNQSMATLEQSIYDSGASLMLHEYQRDLPAAKTTLYAKALGLESRWKHQGHIDVLYHDGEYISEVSRSSVFIVNAGQLITNKANVLKGITQTNLLRAVDNHYPVQIRDVTLSEVLEADEVFITSTTKRVLPIVKIEDQVIGNGIVGEITKNISGLFQNYIESYLAERNSTS